ncbi:alcohol dehydrogenase catalytic domain-containing protein [Halosimplex halophilum]|uniref:alcohol dehydrogenase catalytic domain-containing protein n=1 Tax=Halosimplex halophilum TaxID=2559572 RepID=UPI00107F5361|nr:alcohol dehydrogenase catalytic domain-containing protein [Halosimplex halophilum]
MRAAVLTGTESFAVRERDRPTPGPEDVLVRVEACGVCTTDIHLYEGSFGVETPLVPGHEAAGEVVASNRPDVVPEGTRVAVNPTVPCNSCRQCEAGHEQRCERNTSLGGAAETVRDGAFAEYVRVPAGNVEPVGDLPFGPAAIAEPLACSLHGVRRTGVEAGDDVLVVGAGPMGQLLVQTFDALGAGRIVVSEPRDDRRELALDHGATAGIDPADVDPVAAVERATDGRGVAAAVEAIGLPETIQQAYDATRKGGTTLVFGVPEEDATVEVNPFDVFFHERTLTGSYSLTPDDFARAVSFLRTGRVTVDALLSEDLPLSGITEAFDRMRAGEGYRYLVRPGS